MLSFATILSVVMLLPACSQNKDSEQSEREQTSEVTEVAQHQWCYLKTMEGSPMMDGPDTLQRMIDSTQLTITIEGMKVSGMFNYIPAESDARIGTFSGTMDSSNRIEAIYVYDQEGETYKEGLILNWNPERVTYELAELFVVEGVPNLQVVQQEGAESGSLPSTDCAVVNFNHRM